MTAEPTTYPQHTYQPPDGTAQILLVRHGQSQPYDPAKPFDLVDGHGDPHLTERGHFQAKQLGERLGNEPITAIYVSTLTRTHQTAAPLASKLGLDVRVESDLREVFLGTGEGGRFREMSTNGHPEAIAVREAKEWSMVTGAESNQQLTERTSQAVWSIACRHVDELVVAVCHGGVIAAVLGYALGIGAMDLGGCRHTGVNHLVIDPRLSGPEAWTVRAFNDGSHAGSLTTDYSPT